MPETANPPAAPGGGQPAQGFGTRAMRLLEIALAATAACFLLEYLVLACRRAGYPYELEWMEGGSLAQVLRILAHRPLYVTPSLDFTPYTYTPLYYYLAAWITPLFHPGFLPLRLLSLACSLGACGMLFVLVRRETGRGLYGLLAAGLFAATFRLGDGFFDLARVDSLFLLLTLASVYLARFGGSWRAQAAAGLLLALAVFAKQSALLLALPLALAAAVLWRRRAAAFVVAFGGALSLGVLALQAQSHGWFLYYVFRLPRLLAVTSLGPAQFLARDLLRPVPIAVLLAVAFLAVGMTRTGRPTAVFYLLFGAGMAAIAYGARRYVGGFRNDLIPAYASLAALAVLALPQLARGVPDQAPRAAASRRGWLALAAGVLLLAQFGLLAYDPRPFVPAGEDRRAGAALVRRIAALPGEVLVPEHAYLAWYAGKPFHAHWMALFDVMRGDPVQSPALVAEIRAALAARRFSALVLATDLWFDEDIHRSYQPAAHPLAPPGRLLPVTGWKSRPEWLFLPRPPAPSVPGVPGVPGGPAPVAAAAVR